MPRLFVFAIGGTGSRVLKSLMMLLASGVKPRTAYEFEIVPLIIDPHRSNDDLKRTERLMQNYQAITAAAGTSNGFFGTQVTTFDQLVSDNARLSEGFTFDLQQVADTQFKEYIHFAGMNTANQALAEVLFSGTSIDKLGQTVDLLDLEMDIGFVGNPNVGSVVLNQFRDSAEFREFASNFSENDRIFIISSIFGGTGAAGFPIVVKNIRNALENTAIDGKAFLSNAKIGAITVLPYFNIQKDESSPIQKSHFIAKAKSALYYYRDNITGNNSVNAMYYIADDHNGAPYENDPGDGGQQNNAHLVELASAMAIVDFLGIPDGNLVSQSGRAVTPIYKEFAIKNDRDEIEFNDLEDPTFNSIALPLTQFLFFRRYLEDQLSTSMGLETWSTRPPEIDSRFVESQFYRTNITEFMTAYGEWLDELSENRRGFAPFNLNADLATMIKGKLAKKGFLRKPLDYKLFDDRLSKHASTQEGTYATAEQKFVAIFYNATQDLIKQKFGF